MCGFFFVGRIVSFLLLLVLCGSVLGSPWSAVEEALERSIIGRTGFSVSDPPTADEARHQMPFLPYDDVGGVGSLYGGDGEDRLSLWGVDSPRGSNSENWDNKCAAAEAVALSFRLSGGRREQEQDRDEHPLVPYPTAMAELASGDLGDKDDPSRLATCFPTRAATARDTEILGLARAHVRRVGGFHESVSSLPPLPQAHFDDDNGGDGDGSDDSSHTGGDNLHMKSGSDAGDGDFHDPFSEHYGRERETVEPADRAAETLMLIRDTIAIARKAGVRVWLDAEWLDASVADQLSQQQQSETYAAGDNLASSRGKKKTGGRALLGAENGEEEDDDVNVLFESDADNVVAGSGGDVGSGEQVRRIASDDGAQGVSQTKESDDGSGNDAAANNDSDNDDSNDDSGNDSGNDSGDDNNDTNDNNDNNEGNNEGSNDEKTEENDVLSRIPTILTRAIGCVGILAEDVPRLRRALIYDSSAPHRKRPGDPVIVFRAEPSLIPFRAINPVSGVFIEALSYGKVASGLNALDDEFSVFDHESAAGDYGSYDSLHGSSAGTNGSSIGVSNGASNGTSNGSSIGSSIGSSNATTNGTSTSIGSPPQNGTDKTGGKGEMPNLLAVRWPYGCAGCEPGIGLVVHSDALFPLVPCSVLGTGGLWCPRKPEQPLAAWFGESSLHAMRRRAEERKARGEGPRDCWFNPDPAELPSLPAGATTVSEINPGDLSETVDHRMVCFAKSQDTSPRARVRSVRRLLYELVSFFESERIPYWLDSGTHLGAARDGRIIPWDDDADVGIAASTLSQFVTASRAHRFRNGVMVLRKNDVIPAKFVDVRTGFYVDVLRYRVVDGYDQQGNSVPFLRLDWPYPCYACYEGHLDLPLSAVMPTAKCTLGKGTRHEKNNFRCPRDDHYVLTSWYGPSWREPDGNTQIQDTSPVDHCWFTGALLRRGFAVETSENTLTALSDSDPTRLYCYDPNRQLLEKGNNEDDDDEENVENAKSSDVDKKNRENRPGTAEYLEKRRSVIESLQGYLLPMLRGIRADHWVERDDKSIPVPTLKTSSTINNSDDVSSDGKGNNNNNNDNNDNNETAGGKPAFPESYFVALTRKGWTRLRKVMKGWAEAGADVKGEKGSSDEGVPQVTRAPPREGVFIMPTPGEERSFPYALFVDPNTGHYVKIVIYDIKSVGDPPRRTLVPRRGAKRASGWGFESRTRRVGRVFPTVPCRVGRVEARCAGGAAGKKGKKRGGKGA